jgi:hypothetical protein
MSIRCLLSALLVLPMLGVAQVNQTNHDRVVVFNNSYPLVDPDASQARGNPFLVVGWQAATVQLVGNTVPTPTALRYDLYRQELRVRQPQGDSVVVPLNRVKEFAPTGSGRRFVCYPAAQLPAEVGGACAEMLADGPHLQLLKFWRKEVVKQAAENSSYATNSTVEVLQEVARYYLRWPADGHLTAVRLKRSSLEQALASQPAALSA